MHRLALAVLVVPALACNLKLPDPCAEGSPLQADPKVQEACQAMETGDEGGDYVCVTPSGAETYALCVPDTYDNNFWWVPNTTENLPGSAVDHRDCWPSATYQAWAGHLNNGQTQPDYLCANPGSSWSSPDGQAFALTESTKSVGYYRTLPSKGWTDPSMTTAVVTYPGSMFSVYCPRGVQCVYPRDFCFCECQADADCSSMTQAEAVCELGMCFYVDEPAAPDHLPPGPPAYGLASWEDGLRVEGDHVTITPAFFTALVPGVVRDDQSFSADGRIEHCGRGSLCDFLGLDVGDTAAVDDDAVGELLEGYTIDVEVTSADGSIRTVTVTMDFDGEL